MPTNPPERRPPAACAVRYCGERGNDTEIYLQFTYSDDIRHDMPARLSLCAEHIRKLSRTIERSVIEDTKG